MENIYKIIKYNPVLDIFELDKDYILWYEYSDGFSARLLRIAFAVDIIYGYKLEVSNFDKKYQKVLLYNEGYLPEEIVAELERLISHEKFTPYPEGYPSFDITMDDASKHTYLFNLDNKPICIYGINFANYPKKPLNLNEQYLLSLHKIVRGWIDTQY